MLKPYQLWIPIVACATVLAAARPVAADKPLGGFNAAELKSIIPALKKNDMIGLSERHPNGQFKAMTLAIRIKAPREVVFDIFQNPKNFYYLSTLFKENEVLQRHGNSLVYSWASRHKLFSFTGMNQIDLYPPRRIDVSFVKSTIGSGGFRFLFYPDGEKHSIVVLSGKLDVKSSEWLIRYLIGGNPAMRQAMNVAIGIVVMKGLKALAERLARNKGPKKHKTKGTANGEVKLLSSKELASLGLLIKRGSVVITRSVKGGKMSQATVIQRVSAPAAKLIYAVGTPEYYEKMIKAVSDIEVHSKTAQTTDFSWKLGFSIFGIESKNRMSFSPDGIKVQGIDGDLDGAVWRWQIMPQGKSHSVVAYHGYADISKAAYILSKTMKREPYLEHGFMAGSNMVMLDAIRRTVEKLK